jgi:hypothetical protein
MDVSLFWRALRFCALWAALIGGVNTVHAADFFWLSSAGHRVSSPGAHCAAAHSGLLGGMMYRNGHVQPNPQDPDRLDCHAEYLTCVGWDMPLCSNSTGTQLAWNPTYMGLYYTRSGVCLGTIDQDTGECIEDDPDICAAKRDTSEPFSRLGMAPDPYMTISAGTDGKKWQHPRTEACLSGCVASTVDQKCTTRVTGSYVCRGTARYTGDQCAEGSGPAPVDTTTDPLPDPTVTQKTEPCVYVETATGFECQSMATWEHEGQHCGEYNGVPTCTGQKQPRANEVVVDTEITTEQQPDGSTVTTKTDTATTTDCKGVDDCTTDKTVTVTKTKTDANGNTTTTEQQCTGSACPGANGPGGEGEEGEEGGEFSAPELGEQGSFGDALEGFSERVGNAPLIAAVSRLGIHGSGSCSFPSFTVPMLGTLSFDAMCANAASWFAPLYTLMLALWAFVAVRTFMEA